MRGAKSKMLNLTSTPGTPSAPQSVFPADTSPYLVTPLPPSYQASRGIK